MGSHHSRQRDNKAMVDDLVERHCGINTQVVEGAFRAVDRANYFRDEPPEVIYGEFPYRSGNLHVSAPSVYGEVVNSLNLRPGLSFLNLGSGTGYLNTIVGLLIGPNGLNHGIEIHADVIEFAKERLNHFKENTCAFYKYDFTEPVFINGNILDLNPDSRYDRIYLGAGCPRQYELFIKRLVNTNGGILIMPYGSGLKRFTRMDENSWKVDKVMDVSFTPMIGPGAIDEYGNNIGDSDTMNRKVIDMPKASIKSLKELCRAAIIQRLRDKTDLANPNLLHSDNVQRRRQRRQMAANAINRVQDQRRADAIRAQRGPASATGAVAVATNRSHNHQHRRQHSVCSLRSRPLAPYHNQSRGQQCCRGIRGQHPLTGAASSLTCQSLPANREQVQRNECHSMPCCPRPTNNVPSSRSTVPSASSSLVTNVKLERPSTSRVDANERRQQQDAASTMTHSAIDQLQAKRVAKFSGDVNHNHNATASISSLTPTKTALSPEASTSRQGGGCKRSRQKDNESDQYDNHSNTQGVKLNGLERGKNNNGNGNGAAADNDDDDDKRHNQAAGAVAIPSGQNGNQNRGQDCPSRGPLAQQLQQQQRRHPVPLFPLGRTVDGRSMSGNRNIGALREYLEHTGPNLRIIAERELDDIFHPGRSVSNPLSNGEGTSFDGHAYQRFLMTARRRYFRSLFRYIHEDFDEENEVSGDEIESSGSMSTASRGGSPGPGDNDNAYDQINEDDEPLDIGSEDGDGEDEEDDDDAGEEEYDEDDDDEEEEVSSIGESWDSFLADANGDSADTSDDEGNLTHDELELDRMIRTTGDRLNIDDESEDELIGVETNDQPSARSELQHQRSRQQEYPIATNNRDQDRLLSTQLRSERSYLNEHQPRPSEQREEQQQASQAVHSSSVSPPKLIADQPSPKDHNDDAEVPAPGTWHCPNKQASTHQAEPSGETPANSILDGLSQASGHDRGPVTISHLTAHLVEPCVIDMRALVQASQRWGTTSLSTHLTHCHLESHRCRRHRHRRCRRHHGHHRVHFNHTNRLSPSPPRPTNNAASGSGSLVRSRSGSSSQGSGGDGNSAACGYNNDNDHCRQPHTDQQCPHKRMRLRQQASHNCRWHRQRRLQQQLLAAANSGRRHFCPLHSTHEDDNDGGAEDSDLQPTRQQQQPTAAASSSGQRKQEAPQRPAGQTQLSARQASEGLASTSSTSAATIQSSAGEATSSPFARQCAHLLRLTAFLEQQQSRRRHPEQTSSLAERLPASSNFRRQLTPDAPLPVATLSSSPPKSTPSSSSFSVSPVASCGTRGSTSVPIQSVFASDAASDDSDAALNRRRANIGFRLCDWLASRNPVDESRASRALNNASVGRSQGVQRTWAEIARLEREFANNRRLQMNQHLRRLYQLNASANGLAQRQRVRGQQIDRLPFRITNAGVCTAKRKRQASESPSSPSSSSSPPSSSASGSVLSPSLRRTICSSASGSASLFVASSNWRHSAANIRRSRTIGSHSANLVQRPQQRCSFSGHKARHVSLMLQRGSSQSTEQNGGPSTSSSLAPSSSSSMLIVSPPSPSLGGLSATAASVAAQSAASTAKAPSFDEQQDASGPKQALSNDQANVAEVTCDDGNKAYLKQLECAVAGPSREVAPQQQMAARHSPSSKMTKADNNDLNTMPTSQANPTPGSATTLHSSSCSGIAAFASAKNPSATSGGANDADEEAEDEDDDSILELDENRHNQLQQQSSIRRRYLHYFHCRRQHSDHSGGHTDRQHSSSQQQRHQLLLGKARELDSHLSAEVKRLRERQTRRRAEWELRRNSARFLGCRARGPAGAAGASASASGECNCSRQAPAGRANGDVASRSSSSATSGAANPRRAAAARAASTSTPQTQRKGEKKKRRENECEKYQKFDLETRM